jgi:hypothetical protein
VNLSFPVDADLSPAVFNQAFRGEGVTAGHSDILSISEHYHAVFITAGNRRVDSTDMWLWWSLCSTNQTHNKENRRIVGNTVGTELLSIFHLLSFKY